MLSIDGDGVRSRGGRTATNTVRRLSVAAERGYACQSAAKRGKARTKSTRTWPLCRAWYSDSVVTAGRKMPKSRVFFPQAALDSWLEQGRVALVDQEMTLLPAGERYRLTPAVRVMQEVAEGSDAHALVGKVKTLEQLASLGGEHCADSVILGDNAYAVIEGFLGELSAPPRSA